MSLEAADNTTDRTGKPSVAVNHNVVVGVDIAHHLTHDVALPLATLDANLRTMLARDVARAVGGVVVVDVD